MPSHPAHAYSGVDSRRVPPPRHMRFQVVQEFQRALFALWAPALQGSFVRRRSVFVGQLDRFFESAAGPCEGPPKLTPHSSLLSIPGVPYDGLRLAEGSILIIPQKNLSQTVPSGQYSRIQHVPFLSAAQSPT